MSEAAANVPTKTMELSSREELAVILERLSAMQTRHLSQRSFHALIDVGITVLRKAKHHLADE